MWECTVSGFFLNQKVVFIILNRSYDECYWCINTFSTKVVILILTCGGATGACQKG